MKKVLRYLIFLLIGAGFIYLAFGKINLVDLWGDVKSADLTWVGLAIVAGMVSNYSRAARWLIIVEPLGYKAKLSNSFHGVMISYLVNFVIPRGGELTRAAILSKSENIPIGTVIGSVVAERVMDLICMFLVIFLALALQYDIITDFFTASSSGPEGSESGSKLWIFILVGGMGVFGILFLIFRKHFNHISLIKRINDLFDSFVQGVIGLRHIKKPLAFAIHSVVIWAMYYLMVFFCFYCIPETSGLGAAAGLTVLVTSTLAVVLPSPGGIGTFHYFVPIALTLYGISPDDGLTYATIAHASQMLMFIVFGLASLLAMLFIQRKALTK